MCNPKPSSSSPFICPTKAHIITPDPKLKNHPPLDDQLQDELHRWPTPKEVKRERILIKGVENKHSFLRM